MPTWQVGCLDPWDEAVREAIRAELPGQFLIEFAKDYGEPEQIRVMEYSDFLLVGLPRVTEAMIMRAPRLHMIQKWGVGFDSIDLAAAERAGVLVAITAGANASPVAEHTIMLMLAVYRRLSLVDHALRQGEWLFSQMRSQCAQLRGKVIGLVGFGNIGRAVARKLQGFEAEVLYYDPRRPPKELEQELNVRFAEFEQLLADSEVVSLHCPGGKGNRNLFNASTFAGMKSGAVLIKTARGEIVNQADLVTALNSGQLSGAGLDVFEPEPPASGNPLLRMNNVVLTPHTAGSVFDNVGDVARHAFRNMVHASRGEPIPEADRIVVPAKPRFAIHGHQSGHQHR